MQGCDDGMAIGSRFPGASFFRYPDIKKEYVRSMARHKRYDITAGITFCHQSDVVVFLEKISDALKDEFVVINCHNGNLIVLKSHTGYA